MKSKKVVLFELLKIILAFLVINLHIESFVLSNPFTPLYYLGWYSVPLYITMNFYFNSDKFKVANFNLSQFTKIIQRLLIPLIFWSIVGFILHPELITIKYLFRQMITGTAVNPPLYYLTTLIYVSVIIFVLKKYLFNNPLLVFSLICLFVLVESTGIEMYFASKLWIQIQLAVVRIFEYFKYALLGLYLPNIYESVNNKLNKKFLYCLTLLLLILDIGFESYFHPSHMSYGGIIQFTTVTLLMISMITFAKIMPLATSNNHILSLSKYTLGIYCLHTFIIERVSWQTNGIFLSLSVFFVSYLIALIIDKIFMGKLNVVVS